VGMPLVEIHVWTRSIRHALPCIIGPEKGLFVDFTLAVHICIIIRDEMMIKSPLKVEITKIRFFP
jgi:hypothetical protein